jgi:MFS family permease
VIDGRAAWIRLAVCVALGSVTSVGMWAVVVVLPTVQSEFGIDRAEASLSYTATMIGFALGNVILGRMVDRIGVVRPLLFAAAGHGAGFSLAALAGDIWLFSLAQGLLIGISTAAGFGPLIADITHWFRRRRGIAVGLVASGNYLAGAIWPLLIGAIAPEHGWRTAYFTIAAICLVVMVPLALLLGARPPREAGRATIATSGAPDRMPVIDLTPRALQWLLSIAGVCCCVAMSMPQVHIVAYCTDLGFGVAVGAEMLSVMVAGGVVSRIASGFIADRVGGLRTLILGSALQCAALFLYLPYDGLAPLYVVSLLFGLAQGGIVPSYAIIVREYLPAHEAGERVGIVIMATILGMAFGGWLSGWIFDLTGSYQAAFLNGIAWNMINLAIAVSLLVRTRPRPVLAA